MDSLTSSSSTNSLTNAAAIALTTSSSLESEGFSAVVSSLLSMASSILVNATIDDAKPVGSSVLHSDGVRNRVDRRRGVSSTEDVSGIFASEDSLTTVKRADFRGGGVAVPVAGDRSRLTLFLRGRNDRVEQIDSASEADVGESYPVCLALIMLGLGFGDGVPTTDGVRLISICGVFVVGVTGSGVLIGSGAIPKSTSISSSSDELDSFSFNVNALLPLIGCFLNASATSSASTGNNNDSFCGCRIFSMVRK